MYTPTSAIKINTLPNQQIRLGLMGVSGTGKTYSALTFPNPIVIDIDGNLLAHNKREDVLVLPFNNYEWVASWYKYSKSLVPYPVRDSVKWWLKNEAIKLEKDQTLILDSWTTLQVEFDRQSDASVEPGPLRTSDGGIDERKFWALKMDYSEEILATLKTLKCNVVVTFHEQDVWSGTKTVSSVEPLMAGKFVKKLGLYFTDFFQTTCEIVKDSSGAIKPNEVKYLWRTKSATSLNVKTRMLNCPALIEPSYKSFTY